MAKRKQKESDAELPELQQPEYDQTIDYAIIVEHYQSQRSLTGQDSGYGILNKNTGVVEMRWSCYSEALQGLILCQETYDKYMTIYKQKMGMLN